MTSHDAPHLPPHRLEMNTQGDLVLRDVTRLETVPDPTDADNLLPVACVALVPATSDAGGSITVTATLLDGSDAEIASHEATLTVSTDAYTPREWEREGTRGRGMERRRRWCGVRSGIRGEIGADQMSEDQDGCAERLRRC